MIQRKIITSAAKIAPLRTRLGRCWPGTISIRSRHVRFSRVDMSSASGRVDGPVGLALERLVLGRLLEAGAAYAVDAWLGVRRVVHELVVLVPAAGRRDLVDVHRLADRLLGTH